jgi:hypothetical protein
MEALETPAIRSISRGVAELSKEFNVTNNSRKRTSPSVEELLARTIRTESGCYEWQGARSGSGYGYVTINVKQYRVSRYILSITKGKPEAGMVAMHLCDNPPCVNPDHLRWGTNRENVLDAIAKGRKTGPRGAKSGHAKFGAETIPVIFALRAAGKTHIEIAQAIGVSYRSIGRILRGERWVDESAPYRQETK